MIKPLDFSRGFIISRRFADFLCVKFWLILGSKFFTIQNLPKLLFCFLSANLRLLYFKLKCSVAICSIAVPIAKEDVAAGDGAFKT